MGFYNRVTGSGNQAQLKGYRRPWTPLRGAQNPNQQSLRKLSMGLTEAIGLMEDPKWMFIRSLIE